jgi:SAM-dependent methyltransferase
MLPDFSRRSTDAEIIDGADVGASDMARVLENLGTINRFLGGYSTTLSALTRLIPPALRRVRILDVGAGGGDMAQRLADWARASGRPADVVAVDLSEQATVFAKRQLGATRDVSIVRGDVLALPFARDAFDVTICSLFLHHFRDDVVVRVLAAMLDVSRYGVVVNDLHRHPLAWVGIRALCALFGAHPIVRHDAAVSVLRGFTRDEIAAAARCVDARHELRWRWAFRHQLVLRRDGDPSPRRTATDTPDARRETLTLEDAQAPPRTPAGVAPAAATSR